MLDVSQVGGKMQGVSGIDTMQGVALVEWGERDVCSTFHVLF